MRTCRTCNAEKPLMDFYVGTHGTIDRDCKPCRCEKVRANRLARADQYKQYERSRATAPHRVAARKEYANTPRGRERQRAGARAYLARNPVKYAAKIACSNAIRDGRLVRQPCEVCADERAQAHHDDYSKPLDVRWLCVSHHAEWHRHNKPKCPEQTPITLARALP